MNRINLLLSKIWSKESSRFLIVGGFNTILGFGFFSLLQLSIGRYITYLGCLLLSQLVMSGIAYFGYKQFVFSTSKGGWRSYLRFQSIYLGSFLTNLFMLPLLVSVVGIHPIPAQALSITVIVVSSYFGHKFFSFKKTTIQRPQSPDVNINIGETTIQKENMTISRNQCFICDEVGTFAYEKKIDDKLINDFTFASRKEPELMHYEYFKCERCNILFSTEVPDNKDLIGAYEDALFDASVESKYAAKAYVKALKPIAINQLSEVLDIGCGDGEFLAEIKISGAKKVSGVEPSPAASSLASDELKINIFNGGYESYKPNQKVDLITLFQTIEHIDDPESYFRWAKQNLKPGGYVAIACHDFTSKVNQILGEKSPIFDIEHLQIFSQTGISQLLKKSGFEVVSIKSYLNTYPLSYWARLAPIPKSIKHSWLFSKSQFSKIPITLPLGNIMAIGRLPR